MGKVAPERIQRFRTELGYTQEDLADLCGVDASCISRWETGKWSPSASNSLRLAQALKVSIEDLYDDGKTPVEDIATKQAVAEFQELKPKERGLVPYTYPGTEKVTRREFGLMITHFSLFFSIVS